MQTSDLDAIHAQLRAVNKALAPPEPAAASAPPVKVAIVAMPAPRHSWAFRVVRDAQGRIETVLVEPA